MKLPTDTSEADGPNLTPIIDVVFLLLIFFLVATEYHDSERELDVTLPQVAQAQPLAMTPELIVNISNKGSYKVSGQEFSERELAALIAQAKKNNPQQTTLIRGDGDSALRHAVRIMGYCNKVQMRYRIAALQEGD
jgi:biopolymer transport protein ExbD